MFEISDSQENGVTIVLPLGKIDTLTSKGFEEHLLGHVRDGNGPLIVDMSGVEYVSSFGLRSLLIVAKQMAPSGRKFILFSLSAQVRAVLQMSGFLRILTVVPDKDAALAKI